MRRALIVAGPTCGGKSAFAMEVARRLGGVVINADSMQVYRELRIVTARPSVADEAAVAHRLYGVRGAAEPGSVAWWRGAAVAAMEEAWGEGSLPIVCGGTGMYLAALTGGLSPVPEIAAGVREEARGMLAALGAEALHARLGEVDPASAAALRPSDGQRLARAWEVWRGTGRGLADWQGCAAETPEEAGPGAFRMVLLDPPREALRAAIGVRFAGMVAAGALEEVAGLLALGLDAGMPAMRATGVPELAAACRGEMSVEEAVRRAVVASGQYVKRQATWFRNRAPVGGEDTHTIHARFAGPEQFSEREWGGIESFVSSRGA